MSCYPTLGSFVIAMAFNSNNSATITLANDTVQYMASYMLIVRQSINVRRVVNGNGNYIGGDDDNNYNVNQNNGGLL